MLAEVRREVGAEGKEEGGGGGERIMLEEEELRGASQVHQSGP